jgi:hypothetical protein
VEGSVWKNCVLLGLGRWWLPDSSDNNDAEF